MRRKLLNVATALSLLLCVATVVLSLLARYRRIDFYSKTYAGPVIVQEDRLWADQTQIEWWSRRNADTTKPFDYDYKRFKIEGAQFHWSRSNGSYFKFELESWLLLAVGGAMPLSWLVGRIRLGARRRRAARGHLCGVCGYDLRATPHRCPECGAVANAPPQTAA